MFKYSTVTEHLYERLKKDIFEISLNLYHNHTAFSSEQINCNIEDRYLSQNRKENTLESFFQFPK